MASTLSSVLQQLVDITTWGKETRKQSVAQSLKTVIHMKWENFQFAHGPCKLMLTGYEDLKE